jgi:hypothetical protein
VADYAELVKGGILNGDYEALFSYSSAASLDALPH